MTACEPKMTISELVIGAGACGQTMHIQGTVEPPKATRKVVLQRTYGGKWKDVSGWAAAGQFSGGSSPTTRASSVNQGTGAYLLSYYLETAGTIHLRVRSNAGSATSRDFYVNVKSPGQPCPARPPVPPGPS